MGSRAERAQEQLDRGSAARLSCNDFERPGFSIPYSCIIRILAKKLTTTRDLLTCVLLCRGAKMSDIAHTDQNIVELGISNAAPDKNAFLINDPQFMDDLEQLKLLRSFLIQQAVPLKRGENALSFGKLNRLRRVWTTGGRSPTLEEWEELEKNTQELYSHLNESLRRRFLYGQIPAWVSQTAAALGVVSLLTMFGAFSFMPNINYVLPCYMLWLAALGAVGSIAFIGMNALAVQDDATFDLTNRRLIVLRIALGALFGVVLTLPFGFQDFIIFVGGLRSGGAGLSPGVATQSVLLLLPFILGFSTPLVIMVLNQFVEAVQSFRQEDGGNTNTTGGRQA
jgi:hypothetical protein